VLVHIGPGYKGSSPYYFSKKCIILSVPVLDGNRTENLVMGSVLPQKIPVPVSTPFVKSDPIQTPFLLPKTGHSEPAPTSAPSTGCLL